MVPQRQPPLRLCQRRHRHTPRAHLGAALDRLLDLERLLHRSSKWRRLRRTSWCPGSRRTRAGSGGRRRGLPLALLVHALDVHGLAPLTLRALRRAARLVRVAFVASPRRASARCACFCAVDRGRHAHHFHYRAMLAPNIISVSHPFLMSECHDGSETYDLTWTLITGCEVAIKVELNARRTSSSSLGLAGTFHLDDQS